MTGGKWPLTNIPVILKTRRKGFGWDRWVEGLVVRSVGRTSGSGATLLKEHFDKTQDSVLARRGVSTGRWAGGGRWWRHGCGRFILQNGWSRCWSHECLVRRAGRSSMSSKVVWGDETEIYGYREEDRRQRELPSTRGVLLFQDTRSRPGARDESLCLYTKGRANKGLPQGLGPSSETLQERSRQSMQQESTIRAVGILEHWLGTNGR